MFAINDKGTLRPLTEKKIIGPKGEQASRQILDLWTPQELREWGIYEVAVDAIPEGHRVVSEQLMLDGDTVRLVYVTEVAPVVPPPNPVDEIGDVALKVILSLQNEIRELKGQAALKDVGELKTELRKTVKAELAEALPADDTPIKH